jgi:tetratricopeptide (TPR) repeat protein
MLSRKSHDHASLRRIKEAEKLIEKTIWDAARQKDQKAELRGYEEARSTLESMTRLSPALEKEKNRILAFCLMRIDDALVSVGNPKDSVTRMKEALEIAERSGDSVGIARCHLALGARLASAGSLVEAESYWNRTLSMAEGHKERDMQQIVGWTFIVKAQFLSREGKNREALETLGRAEQALEAIDNYAGVANADSLIAEIYGKLKDGNKERKYREKSTKLMDKAKLEEK